MNERIRELAEQAWDSLVDEMGDAMYENRDREAGELSIPFLLAYDQRFAELIVRECAGIFEGIYTDQQRPERIDIRIKKHFGVEE